MDSTIRYPYTSTFMLACSTVSIRRIYRAFPPGTALPAEAKRCKVCFVIKPPATDEQLAAQARLIATAKEGLLR